MATDDVAVAPHGVVVLAAGTSRRLGRPKQLLGPHGESLVRRATRLALETAPVDAIVVLGAEAERVRAEVADLDARCVVCAHWAEGLGSSLRAGLESLPASVRGALVLLCDQPGLRADHLSQLVEVWRTDPERAAASGYAGAVGVPALLPRSWFAALGSHGTDRGARDLLRERRDEILVIPNESLAQDLDTPEDFGR